MPNLEGRELGGCKLIRKIGAGGMGEVYLAEQRRVGNRLVAVKVVSPNDSTFTHEAAQDLTRRFQREAALLGQLSHPNILPVHDSGVEDGNLYLVMEYVPEGSLADAIRGASKYKLALPAEVARVVDYIGQVAAALQYTHERGVVHRDVKPGNVLVRVEPDDHWHLLLADFGIARGQDNTSQRTQVTGTFAYMAPEQFSGKFSPASDQYSLAVMAFQLLAGRPPFEGELGALTRAHMFEPPPSLRAFNPNVPPAVDAVIQRALAKAPDARFPTVAAFADALRAAANRQYEPTQRGEIAPLAIGQSPLAHETRPATPPPGTVPVVAPPALPGEAVAPAQPWPGAEADSPSALVRRQRQRSPWRIAAALLAAAVLLVGVSAGLGVLPGVKGFFQPGATPTAHGTSAPQATATATSAPTATPSPTVAVAASVVCASGTTFRITDNATCPPIPSDVTVNTPLIQDRAPSCDTQPGLTWNLTADTQRQCAPASSADQTLTLKDTSTSNLACINAQSVSASDAYFTALVSPQSNNVLLGVRQSAGADTRISGYFFGAVANSSASNDYPAYVAYAQTGATSTTLTGPTLLSGSLNKQFALGILFQGSTLTFYINGNKLTSVTNTAFKDGFVGICTQGSATISDAALYTVKA